MYISVKTAPEVSSNLIFNLPAGSLSLSNVVEVIVLRSLVCVCVCSSSHRQLVYYIFYSVQTVNSPRQEFICPGSKKRLITTGPLHRITMIDFQWQHGKLGF